MTSQRTLQRRSFRGLSVTPGVTYSYQWFRGAAAIVGANQPSYTLTAADFGAEIHVKVTATKPSYFSVVLISTGINYSVSPSTASPSITGEIRVGALVTAADRTYMAGGMPVTPSITETYQWYRAGVAIAAPGGSSPIYEIVAADLGKALTVRVTASHLGFLPSISTSTASQLVGANSLDGWNDQPQVTILLNAPARTLTATSTGIIGPAPLTVAYQWHRGATPIAGATSKTYALSSADYGQSIWVRVTTSKPGYTSIVKNSTPTDYSITGCAPTVSSTSGAIRVGVEVGRHRSVLHEGRAPGAWSAHVAMDSERNRNCGRHESNVRAYVCRLRSSPIREGNNRRARLRVAGRCQHTDRTYIARRN